MPVVATAFLAAPLDVPLEVNSLRILILGATSIRGPQSCEEGRHTPPPRQN